MFLLGRITLFNSLLINFSNRSFIKILRSSYTAPRRTRKVYLILMKIKKNTLAFIDLMLYNKVMLTCYHS